MACSGVLCPGEDAGEVNPGGDYRPWPGNKTGVQNLKKKKLAVRLQQGSNPTTQ